MLFFPGIRIRLLQKSAVRLSNAKLCDGRRRISVDTCASLASLVMQIPFISSGKDQTSAPAPPPERSSLICYR